MKEKKTGSAKQQRHRKSPVKRATPTITAAMEWNETKKSWGKPCARTLSMMTQMDRLLQTLRSRKISLTTMRAVVKIYLSAAYEEKVLSLTRLASEMKVTTACITSVADNIEGLGFAERTINPDDRRCTCIRLTPMGIGFAEWVTTTLVPKSVSEK